MQKPIPLTPELAAKSDITYKKLIDEALVFLAHCGELTMKQQMDIHGLKEPAISANECLGMAARVTAEAALSIQTFADTVEFEKAQNG